MSAAALNEPAPRSRAASRKCAAPSCAAEVEQLDAELLTDDLPIDAYLDRGFEAWLKKKASQNGSR